uniref:Uncharacterized protein n=1 Tax=Plectus sambesii TaxID=2011161 RepID=A0A914VTJ9_9BILA
MRGYRQDVNRIRVSGRRPAFNRQQRRRSGRRRRTERTAVWSRAEPSGAGDGVGATRSIAPRRTARPARHRDRHPDFCQLTKSRSAARRSSSTHNCSPAPPPYPLQRHVAACRRFISARCSGNLV